MKHLQRWGPLLILLVLGGLFTRGLQLDPRHLPSARIDQIAPDFSLPVLADTAPDFSPQALRGQPWVLNVFASWCAACVTEHPRLLALARTGKITLVGLAYKDNPEAIRRWLDQHGGNPYQVVALDRDGRVGIDYGVYGVPETYVIDASGVIRYRHVGPIGEDFFETRLAPLLKAAP